MRLLNPRTLSSGPESGLANQVYALVGYALLAKTQELPLLLPAWATHDANGTALRFEALFDPSAMRDALAPHGVVALLLRDTPSNATFHRPHAMAGWEAFKAFSRERLRLGRLQHPLQRIEDAVYGGLHLSRALRQRVNAVQARLQLTGISFGCLHARIEADMQASWSVVHAGRPPSLDEYLRGMSAVPALRSSDRIFIAVGLAITPEDSSRIDYERTSWGAVLRRSTDLSTGGHKAWHRGMRNASEPSYVAASAVDFELCRRATWFVGWCGSTFARLLARRRAIDHGDGWYSACPEGVTYVAPDDEDARFRRWAMCRVQSPFVRTWAKRSDGTWSAGRQLVVKNCSFGMCDKTEYVTRRDAKRRAQWAAEQRPPARA